MTPYRLTNSGRLDNKREENIVGPASVGSTIVFGGCARDCVGNLVRNLEQCHLIGSFFQDYKIVVYINDDPECADICRFYKVDLIYEELGQKMIKKGQSWERLERLAKFRQKTLDYVRFRFAHYTFFSLLDWDIRYWNANCFIRCCQNNLFGYNAIFANGLQSSKQQFYYDTTAYSGKRRMFTNGFCPVNSAFGGMGIYTMQAALSGYYNADGRCEHLAYHEHMTAAGFNKKAIMRDFVVFRV